MSTRLGKRNDPLPRQLPASSRPLIYRDHLLIPLGLGFHRSSRLSLL
jgi:hypothetical protein